MSFLITNREFTQFVALREEKFRPLEFRSILQIDGSLPPWADRGEIVKVKMTGGVQFTAQNKSEELPMPSIDRDSGFFPIYELETGFDVRDEEAMRWAQLDLGSPFVKLAAANVQACEQTFEQIAAIGTGSIAGAPSLGGLTTNAAAVTAKITAAAQWTASTDPATILAEMHAAVHQVYNESKGVYRCETVLLPPTTYQLIATKRLGDGTSLTILQAFLAAQPGISFDRVKPWYPLEAAGAETVTTRAVFADLSQDTSAKMHISVEMYEHSPARSRFGYQIGQTARTGGVVVEHNTSLVYLDGC